MADTSPLVEFTGEESSCSMTQLLIYAALIVIAICVVRCLFFGESFRPSQTNPLCQGPLRPDWCSLAPWAIPARQGHNDGNPFGPGIRPVACNTPTTGVWVNA